MKFKKMRSRSKVPRSKSGKYFSKHASKTHSSNMRNAPMRGGYRL